MAVGTHKGYVQIWDAAAGKKLSVLEGHTARVGEWIGRSDGGGDSRRSKTLQPFVHFHTQLFSNISHSWSANPLSLSISFFAARCVGLERGPAVVWEPRSRDPAEGHQSPASPVRAPSPRTQTGSLRAQVEHRPPAASLGWK